MNQLEKIIKDSSFVIESGTYTIAKIAGNIKTENCFLVTKDKLETTVIYKSEDNINNIIDKKDNYALIGIDVSVPFYSVGFIAEVTGRLAKENINVLVVSTFSRDYVLINNEHREDSRRILIEMGMSDYSNLRGKTYDVQSFN